MITGRRRARSGLTALCASLVFSALVAASPAAAALGVPAQIAPVTVTGGDTTLALHFAVPNNNGSTITQYVATCSGNGTTVSATSATTPVVVAHLTNNVFYQCSVRARNAVGIGPDSYLSPGMPGVDFNKSTYTYCSPTGAPQLMDFYRPKGNAVVPAVVFVHGGGWYSGTRDVDGSLLTTLLTSRGFAFASIDYRLAPSANPAQQERDVACAVRFLRAHAAMLGIRPDKVGGMGASAGGNLISLLGVNPPKVTSTDQWPGVSETLQAVVDEFGITEFGPDQMAIMPQLRYYFGTSNQSVINSFGPVKYVSQGDAPFLIVHGQLDQTVPVHEATDFYNLLQAARVPSTLVLIAHAGHTFQPAGGNPDPSMPTVYTDEVNFLIQYLR